MNHSQSPRVRRLVCTFVLTCCIAHTALATQDAERRPPAHTQRQSVGPAVQTLPNPIMFVTQYPVTEDFGTIGSVFANHRGDIQLSGRGGDLYIVYPDGALRNLTAEAGYGVAGGQLQAGPNAIAVRDPAVHWSGAKAVFSMVMGAPTQMFGNSVYYWQLYEVTGLGEGETASISKVPNQPPTYNNVQPAYDSDGNIIFVSDRVRHTKTMDTSDLASDADRYLYPQLDEYESAPTSTGLWKLDPQTGQLWLMEHAVSGSGWPFVDSFGRVIFSRWDHLLRDQQNDGDATTDYGTFNYSGEGPDSVPTLDRTEVFRSRDTFRRRIRPASSRSRSTCSARGSFFRTAPARKRSITSVATNCRTTSTARSTPIRISSNSSSIRCSA